MKVSFFRRRRRRLTAVAVVENTIGALDNDNNKSTMIDSSNYIADVSTKNSKQNKHHNKDHRKSHRHPYDVLIDNDDGYACADDDQYYNEYRVAEVGQPPKRTLRKVETMRFKLHNFEHCQERRGQYRITPSLRAHGYNWKLQVYPKGDNRSSEETEHVSCFLHYFVSPNDRVEPTAKVTYRIGTHKTDTQLCTFSIDKGKCSTSWGLENFLKRKKIIEKYLDEDGALTIKIDIQIAVDRKIVWYPTSVRREPTLTQLYFSSFETGDATFRVLITNINDDNAIQNQYKYYKAHKMILAIRAKILYELVCGESSSSTLEDDGDDGDDDNTIVIDLPGVDQYTFEAMLEHVYTVKRPLIENAQIAMKLLVAADRFCLPELKLYVESVLADKFVDELNAAELILFGDSHSCALLKEIAMDVCVSDPNSVMKTPGWTLIEESDTILSEILKHTHTDCRHYFYNNDPDNDNDNDENDKNNNNKEDKKPTCHKDSDVNVDLDRLDVFSLRERLNEAGLDVDGSRETLIGRLRTLYKTETARMDQLIFRTNEHANV